MDDIMDVEALIYKIKQGSLKSCDEFISQMKVSDGSLNSCDESISQMKVSDDESLLKCLVSFKDCVTMLDENHEHLVGELLTINWASKSADCCDVYKSLMCNLVSVHTVYLQAVLRMIVKQFRLGTDLLKEELGEEKILLDQAVFENLHSLMQHIVQLVPMSVKVIMPLLIEMFPFMKKHVYVQDCYVQNLFIITQYIPSLRQPVLELVIAKLLKIDVQLPKDEILRRRDSIQEESGIFEMEEVKPKVVEIETFETLMVRLFQFLEKSCHDKNGLNWEATKRLYREVLYVFEKLILPTHASNHVQFILFYFCSLRMDICDGFLDYLWKLVQNPNIEAVFRQTAVSYIGSLLARGNFISIQTVMKTLELMTSWLHSYIKMSSDTVQADITHHGAFYAVCQTVFYVFSFRQREILNSKKGLKWAEKLQFQHIVQCRLNPLRVCVPIIVKTFASLTRQHQLAFCDHIIEQNKRLYSLFAYSTGQKTLDPYFPFDPYLLEKSAMYIKSHYRDYDQSIHVEDSDTSDDNDDDDDDDILSDEMGITSPTSSVPATSHSLEKSMLDIMEYGTSPGFSHVKYKT